MSILLEFNSIVDVDDDRFLKPLSMVQEIIDFCIETNQQVPKTPGQVAKCVYDSLVVSYKNAVGEIERILKKTFSKINV